MARALVAFVLASCAPSGSVASPDAFVAHDGQASITDAMPTDAFCLGLGASCRSAPDCCSGICSTDGFCHAPVAHTCAVDGDCPSGLICQTCNHSCIFAPGGACDLSASCPCDYYCSSSLCTPIGTTPPAMCVRNADCPIGRFCNRAVFACQVPMVMATGTGYPCNANADCGVGEMCSNATSAGSCVAIGVTECHTDSDCDVTNGMVCTENQCFHRQGC
jgi:hypothetical protein